MKRLSKFRRMIECSFGPYRLRLILRGEMGWSKYHEHLRKGSCEKQEGVQRKQCDETDEAREKLVFVLRHYVNMSDNTRSI